jgi:crotonobetainyl-CoA:carnitine CoA-transferase CaiB-like acyl-CoA transferase
MQNPVTPSSPAAPLAALAGVRILSLALNLPGPAALMRCRSMGATCAKLEPASTDGKPTDPMAQYAPEAYAAMHEGVALIRANLKTDEGQQLLHAELARTDVLITSFRPSALIKLGLSWEMLHARYPRLSLVAIVGAPGARGEEPGHDLTYLAESGLITGTALPPTLYADMGGSLMASEAVLQALLHRSVHQTGVRIDVALSNAAHYLALPRQWGLTQPSGPVGGAHAGYRVYPCADGRVAVAALEPHFADALSEVAGLSSRNMFSSATHAALAAWLRDRTREELDALALQHDIPLHTLAEI